MTHTRKRLRSSSLFALVVLLYQPTSPEARAADLDGGPCPCAALTVGDLARMDACQLEQLFSSGRVGCLPVGAARGRILLRTEGKLPRARAKLAGMVWKGKYFHCDGRFVNQWAGFRAIASHIAVGPSWLDGQPCIVLEYPEGTAVFGNTRDELREIGPGLFLGRFYERCPCPKLQGYFVLEMDCRKAAPCQPTNCSR